MVENEKFIVEHSRATHRARARDADEEILDKRQPKSRSKLSSYKDVSSTVYTNVGAPLSGEEM